MLNYRAISYPVLMGQLWAIFFAPEKIGMWVFTFCAIAAIGVATYECAKMVDAGLFPCSPKVAGILSALLIAVFLLPNCIVYVVRTESAAMRTLASGKTCMLLLFIFLLYLPWLATVFGDTRKAKKGFTTAAVVLMTAVPFGLVARSYFFNPKYLFFVMMVTKSMDTGGYVFGMLSNKWLPGGNHKLCPSISPKKSWEGAVGGVLLSVLTAWALNAVIPEWSFCLSGAVKVTLAEVLLFGVILAVASICGDLTESALKRKCGVKDSGNIIPGMGGPLDVLDSFIYVAPACILYQVILRYIHG